MYAVIETGGKQLRVEVGQSIYVEKLDVQPGEEVVFNTVVLYANRTTKIGTPYVKGAKVTCKVEKQGRKRRSRSSSTKPRTVLLTANRATDSRIQS